MAENENAPKSRTPNTGKKGKVPVVNIITIAISAIALLSSGASYLAATDGAAQAKANLLSFATQTKAKLESIEAAKGPNGTPVDPEEVKNIVKDTMETFYTNNRSKIAADVAPLIAVQSGESLSESAITALVEQYYRTNIQGQLNTIRTSADEAKNSASYALRRANSAHDQFERIDAKINDIEKRTVTATAPTTKRLKEFNIIDTVKNGTVFVIEAPQKNGKLNTITLMVNESFVSKFGSHKVLGVEVVDGKPRLIVSGGYFIDQVREELSKAELAAIESTKQSRVQQTQPKPESAVAKSTVKPEPKSQSRAVAQNKVYLPDWKIITPIPESQSVVVYDGMNTVQLKKGKYIQGIGTVKDIDFSSGETCFETYCIAGLK
ncbi:hypothetical protein [Vibrio fluvialis]|uniref:hypothetical protein n=1 Tax=Vibrio fluvialis TaxID=676 RepID=UPI0023A959A6|nr:hypothetical protein [Vibrio fluvialis]MDE5179030.1 hypothetical protein [Vibrio fluvialis]